MEMIKKEKKQKIFDRIQTNSEQQNRDWTDLKKHLQSNVYNTFVNICTVEKLQYWNDF